MPYNNDVELRRAQDVQNVIPNSIPLIEDTYKYISESAMHLNNPDDTRRIMECLIRVSQNILCEPQVAQNSVTDHSPMDIAPVSTHIMHDLISMECLNWTLRQNTVTVPDSPHFQHVTPNAGNVAGATTVLSHNLDLLASVSLSGTTEREYLREASSSETDFASTFAARFHRHAEAVNPGRRIGRVRQYNERIAAYNAWTDIFAEDGCRSQSTCKYH